MLVTLNFHKNQNGYYMIYIIIYNLHVHHLHHEFNDSIMKTKTDIQIIK